MSNQDKQDNLFGFEDELGYAYTPPDNKLVSLTYEHYREAGFPYPTFTKEERIQEFRRLQQFQFLSLVKGDTIHYDDTGVRLANSYFPHRYEVVCGKHRTPIEVFRNPQSLRRCIEKCIKMSKKVTDSKLLSMLCIFEGTQVSANFSPAVAGAIYRHLAGEDGKVWDMSCGYGGRLLAALAGTVSEYTGTDPSSETYKGLLNMLDDFPITGRKIEIHHLGSEHYNHSPEGTLDLCFTSPPYFNTEHYSSEPTQSYLAYTYQSEWRSKFLFATFQNCWRALRTAGRMAVNIANVNSFSDLEKVTCVEAQRAGFSHQGVMRIELPKMPGKGSGRRTQGSNDTAPHRKSEPLFIFRKEQ